MTESGPPLIEVEDLDRVRKPADQAFTLPPGAYTDSRVFDAEVQSIFGAQWLCVAREGSVANPGDYICVDLFDQPIVIARGRDNALRAFSRVCLHRAMPIAEGTGNATRFVCPYHNWTYELDGQLRSAPMMDGATGFKPRDCHLPELPLEIWHGFVFVNRNKHAKPLAPQLSHLEPLIENYEFHRMEVVETIEFDSPWNWKILVENFVEAYHHIGTHRTTFEPVYPARDSIIEDNHNEPWVLLRMPGESGVEAEPSMPISPRLSEAQQHELIATCVFPTLLFAASANGATWYQLEPTAYDQMHLKIHAMVLPEAVGMMDEDACRALADMLRTVHEEDIEVNRGPWFGLQAGMTTQGRLSPFEKSIWQLNQLWADSLDL